MTAAIMAILRSLVRFKRVLCSGWDGEKQMLSLGTSQRIS